MKAGFLQFDPVLGDVAGNIAQVDALLDDATADAPDLLVLPELALTGYLLKDRAQVMELADTRDRGAQVEALQRWAQSTGSVIVAGFPEREGNRVFNASILVTPEGDRHVYRKAHLFLNEKDLFDPGDTPLEPVDVNGVRFGMMICFDWYFPETARVLALCGADVICHPSNLVLSHCPDAMRTRCLENRVFAVTANRCGRDVAPGGKELRFTGTSQITGPGGEILLRAGEEESVLGVVSIDPAAARDKWITPRNSMTEDRRADLYGPLV
ncbi:MAG: acyltransferase [Gemmatimonadetes bacterium]|nr:acyltransferase [Gemmatimonadota bacterium]